MAAIKYTLTIYNNCYTHKQRNSFVIIFIYVIIRKLSRSLQVFPLQFVTITKNDSIGTLQIEE